MKNKSASKVNIFILELTIVILIFALAGAISVSLFAKAHNLGQEATDTNMAMMTTQTLAENFKSQDVFIDFTNLSGIKIWPLYYDKDWHYISDLMSTSAPDKAVYSIAANVSSEKTVSGLLATVNYTAFRISKVGSPLYELNIQKYFPGQGGGNK